MMSTLICTVCSGVAVRTDRSVVLPFVCDGCQAIQHDQEADVHQEYEQGCSDTCCADPAGILTPEQIADATVDATIDMVTDIQEQLQVAKELSAGQTELIAQLEAQIGVLAAENMEKQTLLDASAERLQANVVAMSGAIVQMLNDAQEISELKTAFAEVVDVAKALNFYLGFAVEQGQRLEKENEGLKVALDTVERLSGISVPAVYKRD